VFFLAVLWTVIKSREYSPEETASFAENQAREGMVRERRTAAEFVAESGRLIRVGWVLLLVGALLSVWLAREQIHQVMILSGGMAVVGGLLILGGMMQRSGRHDNGFVTILNDLLDMPRTMKQLAWAQFFSWFALFAMWIYTTAAVTSHLYGTTDTTSALYNEGANWVGVSFAAYNGVAALVAFAIPPLAKWSSPKIAHVICLICGALGLVSIFFISDPRMLLGSMVGVGIAWASILAMPYAILTGSLPPSKLGYYMGVFNFFIVIPQIVAAAILGFIVGRFFGGEAIYALLIGGASFLLAAVLMLRVQDTEDAKGARGAVRP
jgi:maltose/moltooligosaccharide transporter